MVCNMICLVSGKSFGIDLELFHLLFTISLLIFPVPCLSCFSSFFFIGFISFLFGLVCLASLFCFTQVR